MIGKGQLLAALFFGAVAGEVIQIIVEEREDSNSLPFGSELALPFGAWCFLVENCVIHYRFPFLLKTPLLRFSLSKEALMIRTILFLILTLGFFSACQVKPPVDSFTSVDRSLRRACENVCRDMDMSLTSIVVVSNRSACVCGVPSKKRKSSAIDQSGGAVAGEVIQIIAEEREDSKSSNANAKFTKKVLGL